MTAVLLSGARALAGEALAERARRAAAGFHGLGLAADSAVAIVQRNDFAFFEAAMGAALLGAYAVPVNWHFKAEEAGYVIADCGAGAVVVHADLMADLQPAIPRGVAVVVVPTPPEVAAAYGLPTARCTPPPGAVAWDDWLARQTPWQAPVPALRANIIYTSGTTGHPKGVRRDPPDARQTAMGAELTRLVFGTGPGMRTVMTGPMYHAAPNRYGLAAARDGDLVVLQPRFDPEGLLALIEKHGITHLHMVPIMFHRLLKLPDAVRSRYDLSSLRHVVHAASPCPPDVKRRMIDWWGPVICEYYGSSECGAVTFHDSAEALARPGTVGRPAPNSEIRILAEDGTVLPAGEIGEVYCRQLAYPDFTYQNRPGERRAIERDGLITSGDMGYLDTDGYLFLCDRKKDMVISGGVNIYPAEIEHVLLAHAHVRDCAVFGIPDEEFGEALCAFVEREGGTQLDAAEVRAHIRAHLAGFKVPRVVEFRDALPREDSGKIFKRQLRAPYWAATGRQI